jgi:drug/metabolite transporter (DMT)-like permease
MPKSDKTQAILWMLAACFGAAVMIVMVRHISENMHPFLIVLFRNGFALLLFLPWLGFGGWQKVKTQKVRLYALRGVLGVTAMFGWFYAVSVMPLADATALSFTSPLFTTLIAVVVLKETIGVHRVVALALGFMGTLVVLRPGTEAFQPVALIMLGAAVFWSCSAILIKTLTKTEHPDAVVFYMTLFMTPLSLPLALTVWEPLSMEQYAWLLALGLVSNIFQVCLARAMAKTELTVILPFDFTRLVFVSILAYLVFSELPDVWTYTGAAIILSSSVYAAYREKHTKHGVSRSKTISTPRA